MMIRLESNKRSQPVLKNLKWIVVAATTFGGSFSAEAIEGPFEVECAVLNPITREPQVIFSRGDEVLLTTDTTIPAAIADSRLTLRTIVKTEIRGFDFDFTLRELAIVPEVVERQQIRGYEEIEADIAEGFEFHGEQLLMLPDNTPPAKIQLRLELSTDDGATSQTCMARLQVR